MDQAQLIEEREQPETDTIQVVKTVMTNDELSDVVVLANPGIEIVQHCDFVVSQDNLECTFQDDIDVIFLIIWSVQWSWVSTLKGS